MESLAQGVDMNEDRTKIQFQIVKAVQAYLQSQVFKKGNTTASTEQLKLQLCFIWMHIKKHVTLQLAHYGYHLARCRNPSSWVQLFHSRLRYHSALQTNLFPCIFHILSQPDFVGGKWLPLRCANLAFGKCNSKSADYFSPEIKSIGLNGFLCLMSSLV